MTKENKELRENRVKREIPALRDPRVCSFHINIDHPLNQTPSKFPQKIFQSLISINLIILLFTGIQGEKGNPGEPGSNGNPGPPGEDATQEACSGEKVGQNLVMKDYANFRDCARLHKL